MLRFPITTKSAVIVTLDGTNPLYPRTQQMGINSCSVARGLSSGATRGQGANILFFSKGP